jgi:uncharacterized protein (TIGR02058 family)
MTLNRVILEMGTGNDLHGGDYTKASIRAVKDAIHHSSLTMVRTLGIDREKVRVNVTIAVQRPELVDVEAVKVVLPMGQVTVNVLEGGLDILDQEGDDITVIANAAIAVWLDI